MQAVAAPRAVSAVIIKGHSLRRACLHVSAVALIKHTYAHHMMMMRVAACMWMVVMAACMWMMMVAACVWMMMMAACYVWLMMMN